ncbi:hypothetical protein Xhom_04903 [Xenorhabdus hominickii]|uniref:Uncharacterized protein n=1 Tax=Xenorhabdus hominickii TaxID=351679 RepID=A0A1V0M4B7_XENHO|nr:hypothetical protein [Xenorhabdus hominickii]PHM51505.1 hypothetical protein Xhom_04903 [Xenorhabdus hominickii]
MSQEAKAGAKFLGYSFAQKFCTRVIYPCWITNLGYVFSTSEGSE